MKDSRHVPSIQYECNHNECKYKTKRYTNPLKAEVMLLRHELKEHIGYILDLRVLRVKRQNLQRKIPLVKSGV